MLDFTMLAAAGGPALATFVAYTLVVFGLAALSSRLLKNRSFLSEYFLGSRSLGVWALALTFAATSASGGSFTGFPALIYTHGWVLALWISSYMIFPICTMGFLGKRLNQVARKTGAITVPDVLRDRFQSSAFAILATSLLIFFTCVNLVGQFKAGSVILMTLLGENTAYLVARSTVGTVLSSVPMLASLEPGYVLCLLTFGVAVIVYTTWGGFHAVVWTDVMQGIVMVIGVMIMLPLAIYQVGGLGNATRELAAMVPPHSAEFALTMESADANVIQGSWLQTTTTDDAEPRVFRVAEPKLDNTKQQVLNDEGLPIFVGIEIVDAGDLRRIQDGKVDVVFTESVKISEVLFSTAGAFPAEGQSGSFVTAPGPHSNDVAGFLPMSLAFSMFFFWAISGTGQPGNMVRLMAFRDTRTLRMSIMTVSIYFTFIYFPLVIIFCCSRLLLPGMEVEADRVMPQMAVTLTANAGVGWLAGLLVAAPFAAVMSTVDSFLLMISSSVVRDIYQHNINPKATSKQLQRMSYICTVVVGTGIVIAALNPPKFLQYLIVYVGSGLAACFLAPMTLGLYWKRTTAIGATASMVFGFLSHLSLYVAGWYFSTDGDGFSKPLRPLSLDPVVIGIAASFAAGIVFSLATKAPPRELVLKYFYREQTATADEG